MRRHRIFCCDYSMFIIIFRGVKTWLITRIEVKFIIYTALYMFSYGASPFWVVFQFAPSWVLKASITNFATLVVAR